MIPWVFIDAADVPGGEGQLRLMQRGSEFSIMVGTNELMNSRIRGSEEALAELSWAKISHRPNAHMLIGGLGMGFTLRAAQALLPSTTKITVAELVPQVIAWAKGPMVEVHGDSFADPRLTIRAGDVGKLLEAENAYDAILLDVDNGPHGVVREGNDKLYTTAGLRKAMRALRPGGVLAVWSAHPSVPFTKRLTAAGFAVSEERVRARGSKGGSRHHIWLASKA
jgi:spermidine synthase